MTEFIKDVICYPYSIPIGLLNTIISGTGKSIIGFCSETTTKNLGYNKQTDENMGIALQREINRRDAIISSQSQVFAASLLNVFQNQGRRSESSTSVHTHNNVTLTCPSTSDISRSDELFVAMEERNLEMIREIMEQDEVIGEIEDHVERAVDPNTSELTWRHFLSIKDSSNVRNKRILYKKYVPEDKTSTPTIPGWPGGYIYLPTFLYDTERRLYCCPNIIQTINIENQTFTIDRTVLLDEIRTITEAHIDTTLTEIGTEESRTAMMEIQTNSDILEALQLNIIESFEQLTNQNINVEQNLTYQSDPRCDYSRTIFYGDYRNLQNDEYEDRRTELQEKFNDFVNDDRDIMVKVYDPIYYDFNGIEMKQSIDISTFIKNTILSTNTLIMKNFNDVDSKTDVKITRITNARIIVVSLLINIICIYLSFKVLMLIIF